MLGLLRSIGTFQIISRALDHLESQTAHKKSRTRHRFGQGQGGHSVKKKVCFLNFCCFYQVLSECSSACIICKILCHCSISSCTDNRISQHILDKKHVESFGRFSLWIHWVENVFHCSYRWPTTWGKSLETIQNILVFATSLGFPNLWARLFIKWKKRWRIIIFHISSFFFIFLFFFLTGNIQCISHFKNMNVGKRNQGFVCFSL